jgi:maltose/moltooligosaccharide transporter
MGSRSYDWLNYPTYNWLFFRQDLDKIRTKKTLLLAGAILASAALFIMPNSPVLWFAAGMLWIMDSINVSMEPFRAFVGDNLPEKQRTMGFAMQSFFYGLALTSHQNYRFTYYGVQKYSSRCYSRFS